MATRAVGGKVLTAENPMRYRATATFQDICHRAFLA
jgi:hypothetical protein